MYPKKKGSETMNWLFIIPEPNMEGIMSSYWELVKKGAPFALFLTIITCIWIFIFNSMSILSRIHLYVYAIYFVGLFLLVSPISVIILRNTIKKRW